MNRLELPLFPLMLVLSLLVHGAAFVAFGSVVVTPPELISPQQGVASIRLVASDSSRPEPAEKPSDLLADLPILNDPVNLPLPDPRVAELKPQPLERPHERTEPTPKLMSETKMTTPAEVPDLLPEILPTISSKVVEKQPDLFKPFSMNRPRTEKLELPKLETITKVSVVVSKPAPASQATEGVVDDLPRILALNPPPPYPEEARAAGQQGTVWLRLTISAEGRVTAISIQSSSGVRSLDNSAFSTVRRWIFAPARRGGRPVPFEFLHSVEFTIRR